MVFGGTEKVRAGTHPSRLAISGRSDGAITLTASIYWLQIGGGGGGAGGSGVGGREDQGVMSHQKAYTLIAWLKCDPFSRLDDGVLSWLSSLLGYLAR